MTKPTPVSMGPSGGRSKEQSAAQKLERPYKATKRRGQKASSGVSEVFQILLIKSPGD
jgi:hypothetical protein